MLRDTQIQIQIRKKKKTKNKNYVKRPHETKKANRRVIPFHFGSVRVLPQTKVPPHSSIVFNRRPGPERCNAMTKCKCERVQTATIWCLSRRLKIVMWCARSQPRADIHPIWDATWLICRLIYFWMFLCFITNVTNEIVYTMRRRSIRCDRSSCSRSNYSAAKITIYIVCSNNRAAMHWRNQLAAAARENCFETGKDQK